MKKKKVLFVINTLGRAGAEVALLSLFSALDPNKYDISLYVIMAQGEMADELPSYVHLRNPYFSTESVLTEDGRKDLMCTVMRKMIKNGHWFQKVSYMLQVWKQMKQTGTMLPDKILWRVLSDGSENFEKEFDLAVAYLEGASTYYVADHVKAKKKVAFVHIDYESSGYTPFMDKDCYEKMDRIFAVSDEVKAHFLKCYPQYQNKVGVFHNIIDRSQIKKMANEAGGFTDQYEGIRILTVGRLTYQKAYDIAIDAMRLVKQSGCKARWYVLGEGNEREKLEKKIKELGLEEEFLLLGAVENPYPYYAQADLYVHATRFEGKSIAIQEAQVLGCPVIASDCNGNREQIESGVDGILCKLSPEDIAKSIEELIADPKKRQIYAKCAQERNKENKEEINQLLTMMR